MWQIISSGLYKRYWDYNVFNGFIFTDLSFLIFLHEWMEWDVLPFSSQV